MNVYIVSLLNQLGIQLKFNWTFGSRIRGQPSHPAYKHASKTIFVIICSYKKTGMNVITITCTQSKGKVKCNALHPTESM